MFSDHPELLARPILQLSGDWEECHTEAGIPCGAVTGLTATMQKRIVRWMYCVPACAGKVKDAAAKYYLALRLSLPRDVGHDHRRQPQHAHQPRPCRSITRKNP